MLRGKRLQFRGQTIATGRQQRGDTIVEVLIAIAIVGAVLGGAYVSSNHSLNTTRDSEEHTAAIKLLQGQLEQLKAYAASDDDALSNSTLNSLFCMAQTGSSIKPVPSSNPACQVDSTGTHSVEQPSYTLIGSRSTDGYSYTFKINWPAITGGNNTEQLVYRLHQ